MPHKPNRANGASRSKPRPKSNPPAKRATPADPIAETRKRVDALRAIREPVYRAELAEWQNARGGRIDGAREGQYFIHEEGGDRKLIATIIINPEIASGMEAWGIAQLMACAPDLWRVLARIAPSTETYDCNEDLNEATEALTNAASRRPFDWRIPCRDEWIFARTMRDAGFVVASSIKSENPDGGGK